MASPQAENGHVDLANELIEALAKIRISGEEMQCLWVIIRKTYGWKKKEDWIALSQFQDMTGISKPSIIRALKKLLDKNIIDKKDNAKGVSYGIQKDYRKWKPLTKKSTFTKKSIGVNNIVNGVDKKDNELLTKKLPTKDTSTKDTYTKDTSTKEVADFKIFYKAYPKKRSAGKAEERWNKIKPDKQLLDIMLVKIEEAKLSEEWIKDKGQYIPYPASWLNAKGWLDEYKPPEQQVGSDKTQGNWDMVKRRKEARAKKEAEDAKRLQG